MENLIRNILDFCYWTMAVIVGLGYGLFFALMVFCLYLLLTGPWPPR